MELGFVNSENAGIRICILEILRVPIFRQNGQNRLFRHKFAKKWILGTEFQKSNPRIEISTSKILCVPIFLVKTGNFELFFSV